MPEIEYTWEDVSRLGDKINNVDLSQAEYALMSAMLGLANDVIAGRSAGDGVRVIPDDRGVIEYDDTTELGSQVSQALDPTAARSPVANFRIIPH